MVKLKTSERRGRGGRGERGCKRGGRKSRKRSLQVESTPNLEIQKEFEVGVEEDKEMEDFEDTTIIMEESSKKRKKEDKQLDEEFEQEFSIALDIGQGKDVIESLAINPGKIGLLIPLCHCVVNTRVRGLRTDMDSLKQALEAEKYIQQKGMFILSTTLPDDVSQEVTDELEQSWDSCWRDVNAEFEAQIVDDVDWSFLSQKMFFVWEGNHRTVAWMSLIKEKFKTSKAWHIRVLASFITLEKET